MGVFDKTNLSYLLPEPINCNSSTGIKTSKINSESIEIYPNPVYNHQAIKINLVKSENVEIGLIDASGRLIKIIYSGKALPNEHLINVDLSNISNGIYFYNISIGGDKIHRK